MKVLFFANRIKYGGGEKTLSNNGINVYYAIPNSIKDYSEQLVEADLNGIVKVVNFDFGQKKKNIIKYYYQISKLYKDNGIDMIIYFGGSLIEQMAARNNGVRILLSERFYNGFRPLPSRILKQIQYRMSDGYVFQTPEASKTYGKRAERKGTIIPNPIIDNLPDPQFDYLRKEIVTAGRLMPQKDHKTLVSAFAVFHQKYPDYKLIIYGSGPLKDALLKQIADLHIGDSVNIISGKTNISELERGAELFVLSSLAEGMPNALIEAMSMGVMSISTDCPVYGSRMLVKHGQNGYLVPVGDIGKLAEMMCYAVEDEKQANKIRRESVKIRETLEEKKIAQRWIDYIYTIVAKS